MEELPELYKLEASAAADVASATARHHRIQRIIARREALLANKPPRPRRGNLRPVIAIPLGLGGGAAALKAWLAHRRTVTAAAGGAVAGAAAGILGAILINPGHPGPEQLAEPAPPPPAIALPPYGHTPPPVGPPKGNAPAAPPTGTTPLPPPPSSTATPPDNTATPPGTQPPATTLPADPPATATQLCRIYLPKLGICRLRIRG